MSSEISTSETEAIVPNHNFDDTVKVLLIAWAVSDATVVLTDPVSSIPSLSASIKTRQPSKPGSVGAFVALASRSRYTYPPIEPSGAKFPKSTFFTFRWLSAPSGSVGLSLAATVTCHAALLQIAAGI